MTSDSFSSWLVLPVPSALNPVRTLDAWCFVPVRWTSQRLNSSSHNHYLANFAHESADMSNLFKTLWSVPIIKRLHFTYGPRNDTLHTTDRHSLRKCLASLRRWYVCVTNIRLAARHHFSVLRKRFLLGSCKHRHWLCIDPLHLGVLGSVDFWVVLWSVFLRVFRC